MRDSVSEREKLSVGEGEPEGVLALGREIERAAEAHRTGQKERGRECVCVWERESERKRDTVRRARA